MKRVCAMLLSLVFFLTPVLGSAATWGDIIASLQSIGSYNDGSTTASLEDDTVTVSGGKIYNVVITDKELPYADFHSTINMLAHNYVFKDINIYNKDTVNTSMHLYSSGKDENYSLTLNNVTTPGVVASASNGANMQVNFNGNNDIQSVIIATHGTEKGNNVAINDGTLTTYSLDITDSTFINNNELLHSDPYYSLFGEYLDLIILTTENGSIINNGSLSSGDIALHSVSSGSSSFINNGDLSVDGSIFFCSDTVQQLSSPVNTFKNNGDLTISNHDMSPIVLVKNGSHNTENTYFVNDINRYTNVYFNSDEEAIAWAYNMFDTNETFPGTELYVPVMNTDTGKVEVHKLIIDIPQPEQPEDQNDGGAFWDPEWVPSLWEQRRHEMEERRKRDSAGNVMASPYWGYQLNLGYTSRNMWVRGKDGAKIFHKSTVNWVGTGRDAGKNLTLKVQGEDMEGVNIRYDQSVLDIFDRCGITQVTVVSESGEPYMQYMVSDLRAVRERYDLKPEEILVVGGMDDEIMKCTGDQNSETVVLE